MKIIEYYIYRQFRLPFLFIFLALTIVAVLTQALRELGLMTGNRESAIAFLKVVLFSTPLLASQILPISFFLATLFMLNCFVEDSEAPVAFGSGLSPWTITVPLLRLGCLLVVLHLAISMWVQPFFLKERRDTLYFARHDILANLVKSKEFITPVKGLTIFARSGGITMLNDVIIHDETGDDVAVTTLAKTGRLINNETELILEDGLIQTREGNDEVLTVGFEQHSYPLPIEKNYGNDLIYKASDRYLSDLLYPDLTQFYEKQNLHKFRVEAVNRLVQPFMSLSYIMLACGLLLGGELPRQGFSRKIGYTCTIGAIILLATLSLSETTSDMPALIPLLIAWPALVFLLGLLAMKRPPNFQFPGMKWWLNWQKKRYSEKRSLDDIPGYRSRL